MTLGSATAPDGIPHGADLHFGVGVPVGIRLLVAVARGDGIARFGLVIANPQVLSVGRILDRKLDRE